MPKAKLLSVICSSNWEVVKVPALSKRFTDTICIILCVFRHPVNHPKEFEICESFQTLPKPVSKLTFDSKVTKNEIERPPTFCQKGLQKRLLCHNFYTPRIGEIAHPYIWITTVHLTFCTWISNFFGNFKIFTFQLNFREPAIMTSSGPLAGGGGPNDDHIFHTKI